MSVGVYSRDPVESCQDKEDKALSMGMKAFREVNSQKLHHCCCLLLKQYTTIISTNYNLKLVRLTN